MREEQLKLIYPLEKTHNSIEIDSALFIQRQTNLSLTFLSHISSGHCVYYYCSCILSFVLYTVYIYIYIYAFSRRFYPKRLTLHSSYSFFTFYQLLLSLGMFYAVLCMLMIEPLVYVISPIPCLVSLNSTSDDINESV